MTPQTTPRTLRARVAVVAILSLIVTGYALAIYLPADPSGATLELRADVWWHFPMLLAHIFTGAVALALGPWQFVRRVRRRPRLHRYIGRCYLFAGVFPSSLLGMVVAWLSASGFFGSLGLALMSAAWFVTGVMGYRMARARRFQDHRRWMLRNFALTFTGVTFRAWLGILIAVQLPWLESGFDGEVGLLVLNALMLSPWFSLIGNLLIIELYIRRRAGHRPRAAARPVQEAPVAIS